MPAPVAPASPPLPRSPSTHYPPINGPGDGGGGRLALPRRGQGYWGPPGTKVPSWLPGWQEVSTAERGWKQAPHMPARGVSMVPRLSYPTRTLPEVWHRTLEGGGRAQPPPHGPLMTLPHLGPLEQGLGSCLPGLFPPLCAGLWGQRSWAPTPRWPICFLGSPPPAPLTWGLPS